MKVKIIIILVLITVNCFSQDYFRFPTSDAVWNYKIVGSLSYPYEWPVIDSLGQETTIGSHQYIEVYTAAHGSSNIVGAIREDTLTKKVYFHNFTNEIVLYDFSLEVGDTIHYTTNLWYSLDYFKVVNSVDLISINGQDRKIWHLSNSYLDMSDVWIEGIGSVSRNGLLYPNNPDIVMDASNLYFGCFKHDTIVYINSSICAGTCPCMDWLVKVDEFDNLNKEIILHPNPTTGKVNLELDKSYTDVKINVRTIEGKLVQTIDTVNDNISFEINGSAGMYFVEVISKGEKIVFKVVKE